MHTKQFWFKLPTTCVWAIWRERSCLITNHSRAFHFNLHAKKFCHSSIIHFAFSVLLIRCFSMESRDFFQLQFPRRNRNNVTMQAKRTVVVSLNLIVVWLSQVLVADVLHFTEVWIFHYLIQRIISRHLACVFPAPHCSLFTIAPIFVRGHFEAGSFRCPYLLQRRIHGSDFPVIMLAWKIFVRRPFHPHKQLDDAFFCVFAIGSTTFDKTQKQDKSVVMMLLRFSVLRNFKTKEIVCHEVRKDFRCIIVWTAVVVLFSFIVLVVFTLESMPVKRHWLSKPKYWRCCAARVV